MDTNAIIIVTIMQLAVNWMKPLNKAVINTISGISLIILVSLIIGISIAVYRSPDMFSSDSIKMHSAPYIWIMAVLLLIILICSVLSLYFKDRELSFTIKPDNRLRLIKSKISELPESAVKEEKKRVYISTAAYSVIGVSLLSILLYLLNRNNFKSMEVDDVVFYMLIAILPEIVLSALAYVVSEVLKNRSYLREIELLSNTERTTGIDKDNIESSSGFLSLSIFISAIVLIVLGILNGGASDVLIKAVNICTECIGIG